MYRLPTLAQQSPLPEFAAAAVAIARFLPIHHAGLSSATSKTLLLRLFFPSSCCLIWILPRSQTSVAAGIIARSSVDQRRLSSISLWTPPPFSPFSARCCSMLFRHRGGQQSPSTWSTIFFSESIMSALFFSQLMDWWWAHLRNPILLSALFIVPYLIVSVKLDMKT